ncbi:MAG: hypothetical protein K2Y39_21345 [Candidatus Obscuribacterales bacterium]|nr:hypothetical protein [Candidatus Obscuribacterales bacterium]
MMTNVSRLRQLNYLLIAAAAAGLLSANPAAAQDSEREMERLLNKVEDSRGMQQGIQQQQSMLNREQLQRQMQQTPMQGGYNPAMQNGLQGGYPGGYQNNYQGSNGFSYPQRNNSIFSQSPLRPQQQPVRQSPFASLFGGGQQAAPVQPRGPMTKRDLLRMFLEGDNSSSTSAGNSAQAQYQKQQSNQRKYNNAAQYRQTAEDAAMRALGAEERTRYGNKSSRMSAADEAYYAAQAARGAANSATSAAAGGGVSASDAAASARNAADRAQGSADRARSNADSYRDPH